jgi:hypothetical protein
MSLEKKCNLTFSSRTSQHFKDLSASSIIIVRCRQSWQLIANHPSFVTPLHGSSINFMLPEASLSFASAAAEFTEQRECFPGEHEGSSTNSGIRSPSVVFFRHLRGSSTKFEICAPA